jgi:hypothetical protein
MKPISVLVLVCLSTVIYGQESYVNPDVPLSNTMAPFQLIHIESSLKGSYDIIMGQQMGTIAKYPEKLSEEFENEIKLSKSYYDQRDFNGAKSILENAVAKENRNPFILNEYARICKSLLPCG